MSTNMQSLFTTRVSSTPIMLPPPTSTKQQHPRDKARAYDTYVATPQTGGQNITIAFCRKRYHETHQTLHDNVKHYTLTRQHFNFIHINKYSIFESLCWKMFPNNGGIQHKSDQEAQTNDLPQGTTGQGLHHYSNMLHTFHKYNFFFKVTTSLYN